MEQSMKILKEISILCYSDIYYYNDNRSVCANNSTSYITGRIDASVWINNLVDTFLKHENIIIAKFIDLLSIKKLNIVAINNDDYNQGLYDQLEEMEIKINDRIS